jgi:hypothetical protein
VLLTIRPFAESETRAMPLGFILRVRPEQRKACTLIGDSLGEGTGRDDAGSGGQRIEAGARRSVTIAHFFQRSIRARMRQIAQQETSDK